MLFLQRITNKIYIQLKYKKALSRYNNLKKYSQLSLEEIENEQLSKLNKILNHAYKNNHYYKNLLDEYYNIENDKIELTTLSELQLIPFLTKDIIRKEKEKMYSNNHQKRGSRKNTSGGSTGEPVLFIQDDLYRLGCDANFFLFRSWMGIEPYDSNISIWGAIRDTFEGRKPLSIYIKDFFRNRIILNSFKMSEEDIKKYIELLNKHKPQVITAYVESIYQLAKFSKEKNILIEKQNVIHSAAGTLYDFMREEIENSFQCKVYNHYGSREVGSMASECSQHDGLHIIMDRTLIEIVNEHGETCKPGEQGEIVVTNLDNYSMPLIRYKIGDVGVFQEYTNCDCGCNYPKLKKVIGRTSDLFKNKAGDLIDGQYFMVMLYFIEGIKNIQIIQKALDKIIVRIVKEDSFSDDILQNIEKKIKLLMGDDCKVVFDFVDEIVKTKTGKHLYTISEI